MTEAARLKRKGFVQTLRLLSDKCQDVATIRDDSGKDKVEKFAADLKRSRYLDTAARAELAQTVEAYLATFPPAAAGGAAAAGAGNKQTSGFRVRGRSFLLSYNWDFLNKAFPDGSASCGTPAKLWQTWTAWEQNKKQELEVEQSTSTLESSLHSDLAGRVHFHWKVNLKTALDEPSTLLFAFHGVRPDARPTFVTAATKQARGANFAEASNRGHFYTWVDKVGSLYKESNWEPWRNYRVLGKWLDDLWTDGIHKCTGLVLDVALSNVVRTPDSQVTAPGPQGL
jgi:hypothetical protein